MVNYWSDLASSLTSLFDDDKPKTDIIFPLNPLIPGSQQINPWFNNNYTYPASKELDNAVVYVKDTYNELSGYINLLLLLGSLVAIKILFK
jgi:hypothetical protein